MIHQVLPTIIGELNEYLQSRFGMGDDQIVLGNIVNQDGSLAVDGNKLVVSLINIERDGTKGPMTSLGSHRPPVYINLYVIFSGVYSSNNINNADYLESLKIISGVISFFQGYPVFDAHNTPDWPDDAGKVQVSIENVQFQELVNLWSITGSKYVPSIIYRFRSLNMDMDLVTDEIPPISGITA